MPALSLRATSFARRGVMKGAAAVLALALVVLGCGSDPEPTPESQLLTGRPDNNLQTGCYPESKSGLVTFDPRYGTAMITDQIGDLLPLCHRMALGLHRLAIRVRSQGSEQSRTGCPGDREALRDVRGFRGPRRLAQTPGQGVLGLWRGYPVAVGHRQEGLGKAHQVAMVLWPPAWNGSRRVK